MRHRGQNEASETEGTTLVTLADLKASTATAPGKHRAPVMPQIPEQKLPTHDMAVEAPAPAPVVPEDGTGTPEAAPELEIPPAAQWRASHLPRVLTGALLAMAVVGTSALGVRYAESRTSDDFISLAIGLGVVVVLWAVLIASTPQVVSLNGSVLTVRNTGGSETFDLTDGLQAVDVVGDPRTSHWAVLLHRPNNTTVVLRRHDVNATEVDPIVRHYRTVATRRFTEREARFST